MALQKCKSFKDPKAYLEQYTIPADIAADVLYLAYLKGDIAGKVVYDLGCGTGRLAIGSVLLGAREVWGFDKDQDALLIARMNSSNIGVDVKWREMDIANVKGKCDTVVQNP
ncbi:MAG: METTL5 family protein, partial [Candidatus Hydrothermarchaeales archaeon]